MQHDLSSLFLGQAPHCIHMRSGVKMGNTELVDTMVEDGLKDCLHKCLMVHTAENVVRKWNVKRDTQVIKMVLLIKSNVYVTLCK